MVKFSNGQLSFALGFLLIRIPVNYFVTYPTWKNISGVYHAEYTSGGHILAIPHAFYDETVSVHVALVPGQVVVEG